MFISTDQGDWINVQHIVRYTRTAPPAMMNPRVSYTFYLSTKETRTCTVRAGVLEDRLLKQLGGK